MGFGFELIHIREDYDVEGLNREKWKRWWKHFVCFCFSFSLAFPSTVCQWCGNEKPCGLSPREGAGEVRWFCAWSVNGGGKDNSISGLCGLITQGSVKISEWFIMFMTNSYLTLKRERFKMGETCSQKTTFKWN